MDLAGLGSDAVRPIATDAEGRIDLAKLARSRWRPTAPRACSRSSWSARPERWTPAPSTISTAMAAFAAEGEGSAFHVDGAFGALAVLSPELAPLVKGIERPIPSPSISTNGGRCLTTPAFVLVRDGKLHRDTFASRPPICAQCQGPGCGAPWPPISGPTCRAASGR
jgi:aromatic-L-amino-acid decarboxylase